MRRPSNHALAPNITLAWRWHLADVARIWPDRVGQQNYLEFATIRGSTVAAPSAWLEVVMANTELLARLDAAIAEKNLLKHPFYQDWQAGKLTREALQLYAAQYYPHLEAFPKHLRVLAARTPDPLPP